MCQFTSGATSWKMKFGWSARNSQGTCPMVEDASPEDGKSLPLILQGAVQVWVNVPKPHLEPLAMDDALSWAGQGWKDPSLNSSPENLNPGWSAWNSQGTFQHGRVYLPWRWQVPTTITQGAVQVWVNVPNHIRSWRLKNEGWPICSKLTGDLPHHEGNIPLRQQVHT